MFIFTTFFDGRACSSWRYPDILVSPGEDSGRVLGHLGCLQELSGGCWGSVHEIGVSKGGSWELNLAPLGECLRANQPYYGRILTIFKRRFFNRSVKSLEDIILKPMIFAPRSSMEHSGSMFSVFAGAGGVPLERPRLASSPMTMTYFDGFAFCLERFWRCPRGCKKVRVGAKQGPTTPSKSVWSDFERKTGRRARHKRDFGGGTAECAEVLGGL